MNILAMIAAAALSTNITITVKDADWLVVTNDYSSMVIFFMIDNPETVTTVTNVVEELGRQPVFSDTLIVDDYGQIISNYEPDGTKTVTTTVKRIYTLTLKYRGIERKLVHEEIVSQTVKKYAKKEEWEEVK